MSSLTRSLPTTLRSPHTQMVQPSASSISVSSDQSNSCHYRMPIHLDPNAMRINQLVSHKYEIPIVGYEVIEERAKFTVFKLRIHNTAQCEYWFIFRRYTDFVRLLNKIKATFPNIKLSLPRKKWFGDNFDSRFLDERIKGLQTFVNTILQSQQLCTAKFIRDFFCLDEPPSFAESVEESRAIIEALEDRIAHLQMQLKNKDAEIANLRMNLSTETKKKDELFRFVTTGKGTGPLDSSVAESKKPVHIVTGGGDYAPSKCAPQVMQVEDVSTMLAQMD